MSQSAGLNNGGSGGGSVTSVSGTTNQIDVSPTTGDVVVSLSDGISIGSYQPNTPPVGGLIVPGQVAFGVATPASTDYFTIYVNSSFDRGLVLAGNLTGVTSSTAYGIASQFIFAPTSSANNIYGLYNTTTNDLEYSSITEGFSGYFNLTVQDSLGLGNTMNNAYGIFCNASVTSPANVTNAYSGYFNAPTGASSNTALYVDNLSVGFTATTPPPLGVNISGQLNIGLTSSLDSTVSIQASSSDYSIIASESVFVQPGSYGIYFAQTFQPATNAADLTAEIYQEPIFDTTNASFTDVALLYQTCNIAGNNTIGVLYGIYNSVSATSNVTNAVGIYATTPTRATTSNTAIYSDNLSVGYTFTSPPSNGAIFQGQVSIGSNSIPSGIRSQIFFNSVDSIALSIAGTPSQGTLIGIQDVTTYTGYSTASSYAINSVYDINFSVSSTYGVDINPTIQGSGILTTYCGVIVQPLTTTSSPAINYAYGGLFYNPGLGSVSVALYGDNMAIGYLNTATTSNGLIVQGTVGIGTSAPLNQLDVNGAVAIGDFAGVDTASPGNLIISGDIGIGIPSPAYNIDILTPGSGVSAEINVFGGTSSNYNNFSSLNLGIVNGTGTNFNVTCTTQFQFNDGFSDIYGLNIQSDSSSNFITFPNCNMTINSAATGSSNRNNTVAIVGNLQIGADIIASSAPPNGLLVEGGIAMGTQAPISFFGLYYLNVINGVVSFISSSDIVGWAMEGTIQVPTTITVQNALSYYINPTFDVSASSAIINEAYGLFIDSGVQLTPGSGSTVTNGVSLMVQQPDYGVNRYAMNVQGGIVFANTIVTTATYAATTADYFISVSYTATGAVTINIPNNASAGWSVIIKDTAGNAATNNITVQVSGNVIDGASNYTISTNHGKVGIYTNGTQYYTFIT